MSRGKRIGLIVLGISLIIFGLILPMAVYHFEFNRLAAPLHGKFGPDGGPLIAIGAKALSHAFLSSFPALAMIISGISLLISADILNLRI